MTTLAPAALPAAVAAGLSVAEITVSGTLWATRLITAAAARRVAYLILASLLVLRLVQAGWELASWNFVRYPPNVFLTWLLLAVLYGGLSVLLLRLAGGRDRLVVSRMPERMASMSLALGLGLVGLSFVAIVILGVFAVAASVAPNQVGATTGAWQQTPDLDRRAEHLPDRLLGRAGRPGHPLGPPRPGRHGAAAGGGRGGRAGPGTELGHRRGARRRNGSGRAESDRHRSTRGGHRGDCTAAAADPGARRRVQWRAGAVRAARLARLRVGSRRCAARVLRVRRWCSSA